jgi:hypothetical protein
MRRLLPCTVVVLYAFVGVLPVVVARAQDTSCSYARCALAIAPVWNGLDVVRGSQAHRVAGLGFFWTGDITPAVAGNDSAVAYATRAVHVRRVAAALTDVGVMALGYAAARRLRKGSFSGNDRGMVIGGSVALASSVPLQFAADGLLSRSLWWFNGVFSH